jgi:uncharacterized protein (DUF58 family)
MSRSPRLVLYAGFAATSFLAALVLARPELAALGAPFLLVLAVGLTLPPPQEVEGSLRPAGQLAIEGDALEAEVTLSATGGAPWVELALLLPDGLKAAADVERLLLHLRREEPRRFTVQLSCERWGTYQPEDLLIRSRDLFGLRSVDRRLRGEQIVRVYPRPERLRALIPPLDTQPFAGNRVARSKGEGIEFADIRPYVPGDRARSINWRTTAMRQTLYVNQQHPERNSDVVIFLDSFAEVRRADSSTLDLAIRAAATLAQHYLAERDRVGLVTFGGVVRWLTPASGTTHLYRILEALLETEIVFSFAWKDVDVLPGRSLTPQALVIALSPLLDGRSVNTLLDLRRRGFDLVVVDVTPLGFVADSSDARSLLAVRFWRLWREALRFRYERLGVSVVEWDGRNPLAEAVEEVRAFRRFARYASA